jgi:ubiquinone/menaquinone biosynthesis C-methylase UbiE
MSVLEREKKLHTHYEKVGSQEDDTVTALDYNLRNLEIDCAKKYLTSNSKVLDVGSGPGIACFEYAKIAANVTGIDFAQSMVDFAKKTLTSKFNDLKDRINFYQGSALDLPFESEKFDIVTTHRVLIALLSFESQKQALSEIARVLQPNGLYVMFEATTEGLAILNNFRKMFGLSEVSEGGCGDYDRLLFSEKELKSFMNTNFELINIHSFGMYYFLTRILQPLFVAPEKPRYDHKLNDVAFEIAKKLPDFENIGHLKGYVWKKRS